MCQTIFDDKGKAIGVACGRGVHGKHRIARCAFPCAGERPVVALCDFILTDGPRKGQTCDLPVCEHHRFAKGEDLDCCWLHRKATLAELQAPAPARQKATAS